MCLLLLLLLLLLRSALSSSIVFFFFPSFLVSFYSIGRVMDSDFIHSDRELSAVPSLLERSGEAPHEWYD